MNNVKNPSDIGYMAEAILRRYIYGFYCDSGVIFLLSKLDRKMYIYSGKHSKSVFTAKRRDEIFDLARDHLKDDDWNPAILDVVMKMKEDIDSGPEKEIHWFIELIANILGLLCFLGCVYSCCWCQEKVTKKCCPNSKFWNSRSGDGGDYGCDGDSDGGCSGGSGGGGSF